MSKVQGSRFNVQGSKVPDRHLLSTLHSPLSTNSNPQSLIPNPLFAFLLLLLLLAPAAADDSTRQVWLIDTRAASHCGQFDRALDNLRYYRLEDCCQWTSADAEKFRASNDKTIPTIVFIHGNATDIQGAARNGMFAYELIRAEAGGRPFRFVIWSWPTEKFLRGIGPDVRLKVDFSDAEGYYLAQWLDGIDPGVRVSLVGHSLGSRIIVVSLHLLAGGEAAGYRMPNDAAKGWTEGRRNPLRTVLLTAAIDAHALASDGEYGRALSVVDQALIAYNPCDRVLRWYPRLYGRGGPQALGFSGPCDLDGKNVELINVACDMGKVHDCRRSCAAAGVCLRWAKYTFLDGSAGEKRE